MTSRRTRNRLVVRLRDQGILDEKVLGVINEIPRHLFVDEALAHRAYEDTALPIGFNQTISQPYVVAKMTEALVCGPPKKRVLEIGTGSGYQTAILAELVEEVFSVERISGLIKRARRILGDIGYRNISFKHADGSLGWESQAPFDSIIITASPRTVPESLLNQLTDDGSVIVPIGDGNKQDLVLFKKTGADFTKTIMEPVKFVPLLAGTS
ncbi:protein-L-isoaspartate(D-aspartate) O-methyltransferase [Gammaproteobacteria bacterium]|nr:protein-L-isoaspartate(D-aspartate) O-methyltransferase [Gammaproteobacteria bacterium]